MLHWENMKKKYLPSCRGLTWILKVPFDPYSIKSLSGQSETPLNPITGNLKILDLPWVPWRRTAAIPNGLLVLGIWVWLVFGICLFAMAVVAAPTALENADIVTGLLGGAPFKSQHCFCPRGFFREKKRYTGVATPDTTAACTVCTV